MDEMISLDLIYLRGICLFSLHHRECYEEEDDRSGDTEIFGFETEKSEEVLSEKKCSEHSD